LTLSRHAKIVLANGPCEYPPRSSRDDAPANQFNSPRVRKSTLIRINNGDARSSYDFNLKWWSNFMLNQLPVRIRACRKHAGAESPDMKEDLLAIGLLLLRLAESYQVCERLERYLAEIRIAKLKSDRIR
jgi:hypothetical protein